MTGRDLILYILSNGLENEPIFKDGTFIGFITVEEAAKRMNVGVATIHVWISLDMLDYIQINNTYLVSAECRFLEIMKGE